MRQSLLEYFYRNASNTGDVAFSHRPKLRRKLWTYAAIARASFQFARELGSRGIDHGDRIVIIGKNSPEWIVAFYGAMLRGVIVVPLDEQSSADFFISICDQTQPKVILKDSELELPVPDIPSLNLEAIETIIAPRSAEPFKAENILSSDTVEIVFTSGTTGQPKGVELTHENILANLEPIERVIGRYIKWKFLIHPIRILDLLPLSHVFGQIMGIFVPQLLSAEVRFHQHLNPAEIIETIRNEKISVLAAVPRVLENLRYKIGRDFEKVIAKVDTTQNWYRRWWTARRIHRAFGLRFLTFITGGATLDPAIEEFWSLLGFVVVQGYGMTETAALISLNNPFSAKRGSLGQIIDGQEVKIGEGGEILVRGKNVSSGYWGGSLSVPPAVTRGLTSDNKDKSAEQASPDQTWFHTGDIGAVDETGRLYFKGRKKDVIVTAAGLNIYPDDLEAVLNRQPAIKESVVVAIDGLNGPEPFAAVIANNENDVKNAVAQANRSLAPFQQIRRWMIWPAADFPRTTTQKVRKNDVADFIRKNPDGVSSKASPIEELVDRLGTGKNIRSDSRLTEDLNLDSLSRVELLSALEDRYQVDLDERAFTESATVGDIEQMLGSRGPRTDERQQFSYPRWTLSRPVSWFRNILFYGILYPVTRVLCRADVRGLEHLRDVSGPVLFASNHVTRDDPALIMSVLPHRFHRRLAIAMDGEMLESFRHPPADMAFLWRIWSVLKYHLLLVFFNVFPLPRLSGFRKSFTYAGEAMDRGYNILIFPEGELTKDGRLQKFQSGVGILADGLECPVVPVRIDGLWELKAAGVRYYAPPGSVTVNFGEPIQFETGISPASIAKTLEDKVSTLSSKSIVNL